MGSRTSESTWTECGLAGANKIQGSLSPRGLSGIRLILIAETDVMAEPKSSFTPLLPVITVGGTINIVEA